MKQTAQGLAALGRGPDTQLVHMAPSEVAGLQALALRHGGSLTINPDTGLPEAGFLSSILPMVLGAGAMMIPGMQGIGAGWIGAGIGGLEALRTGSLSKGFMAGLGAYGGAGLAGSLGAGATVVPSTAPAAGAVVPQSIAPAAQTTVDAFGQTIANPAYAAPVAAPTIAAAPIAAPVAGPSADMLARGVTEGGRAGADLLTSGPQTAAYVAPPVTPPSAAIAPTATTTPAITNPLDARLAAGQATTPLAQTTGDFLNANKYPIGAMGLSALLGMNETGGAGPEQDKGMIRPYTYSREKIPTAFQDVAGAPRSSKERRYFTDQYTALTPYAAPGPEYKTMAAGGPVEAMSNANAIGANTGYPQADIRTGAYATPYQQPMAQNVVTGAQDAAVDPYTGQAQFAGGGGVSDLGSYSDGGRLLRGPGDGVSDSIPAMIGRKQQARLADGEFVVPARIVSELGNGSTEAGARQLYAMMDRVQKARKKSIGKDKVATNSRAAKLLPA